jgi:hypothetical protein
MNEEGGREGGKTYWRDRRARLQLRKRWRGRSCIYLTVKGVGKEEESALRWIFEKE